MSNVSVVTSMKRVAPENRTSLDVFGSDSGSLFSPFSDPFLYKMSGN